TCLEFGADQMVISLFLFVVPKIFVHFSTLPVCQRRERFSGILAQGRPVETVELDRSKFVLEDRKTLNVRCMAHAVILLDALKGRVSFGKLTVRFGNSMGGGADLRPAIPGEEYPYVCPERCSLSRQQL